MSPATDLRSRLLELQRLRRATDAEIRRVARQVAAAERPRQRRSRFDVPPCGTESGYQRHRHRGEDCQPCKAAHAAHERVAAAARRVARAQRKARMAGAA